MKRVISFLFPEKGRLFLILTISLICLYLISGLTNHQQIIEKLEKPAFDQEKRQALVHYEYYQSGRKTEDTLTVDVEHRPLEGDEQLTAIVNEFVDQFEGQMENFKRIDRAIWLPSRYRQVRLKYRFLPATVVDKEGWVYYHRLFEKGGEEEEVVVTVVIMASYQKLRAEREIKIKLSKAAFTESYIQEDTKRAIAEQVALASKVEGKAVVLPEDWQGEKIKWLEGSKPVSLIYFPVVLVIIIGVMAIFSRQLERQKEDLAIKRYRRCFLQFVHHLILLLEAGKNPYNGLLEATSNRKYNQPVFQRALDSCHHHLEHQAKMETALAGLYDAYHLPEVKLFTQYFLMAYHRGDEMSIQYLKQLQADLFRERLTKASVIVQKATSKLIFPMLIFLLIIIGLTLFPTFRQGF